MESSPPATPPPRRRRFGLLKLIGILAAFLILIALAIPWIVSSSFVRARVTRSLSETLGTEVVLNYDLGWSSGLTMTGCRVDNPPGFPEGSPMLAVRRFHGAISLLELLRGRVDVSGAIDGLELRVHQRADGAVNLASLGRERAREPSGGSGGPRTKDVSPPPGSGPDLSAVRLDLRAENCLVEIVDERQGVLESMRDMTLRITKSYGNSDVRVELAASLTPPEEGSEPGRLELQVDADATQSRPLVARMRLERVRLERYRPLVAALLPDQPLEELAGVAEGTLTAHVDLPRRRVELTGKLDVAEPRVAGPLVSGMRMQAPGWTLAPNLRVDFTDERAPKLETSGLLVDLGFARLEGMPAAEARELTRGKPSLGLRFALDLGALGELGGPIPEVLRGRQGAVSGHLAMVVDREAFDLEKLRDRIADLIDASAELAVPELDLEGVQLRDCEGKLRLHGGEMTLQTGARMSGGALALELATDLRDFEQLPARVQMRWSEGRLGKDAVKALRYVLPLLAGLGAEEAVALQGKVGASFEASGPLLPRAGQKRLEWLSQWTGKGGYDVSEGRLALAGPLQQLTQLSGGSGSLPFRKIDGRFQLSNGFLETTLTKLDREARRLGLRGKTGLDGSIDYVVDLADELRRHKDGAKVLELLGDAPPLARLTGTLDSPRLEMPDLAALLRKAAEQALKKGVEKAVEKGLEKGLENTLKKGLEGIFKRK